MRPPRRSEQSYHKVCRWYSHRAHSGCRVIDSNDPDRTINHEWMGTERESSRRRSAVSKRANGARMGKRQESNESERERESGETCAGPRRFPLFFGFVPDRGAASGLRYFPVENVPEWLVPQMVQLRSDPAFVLHPQASQVQRAAVAEASSSSSSSSTSGTAAAGASSSSPSMMVPSTVQLWITSCDGGGTVQLFCRRYSPERE